MQSACGARREADSHRVVEAYGHRLVVGAGLPTLASTTTADALAEPADRLGRPDTGREETASRHPPRRPPPTSMPCCGYRTKGYRALPHARSQARQGCARRSARGLWGRPARSRCRHGRRSRGHARVDRAACGAAEALAAAAWGGERCFFLVNGSTSGIHSLLLALAGPGDSVILPRNAHKSVQAALIFSGAMPHYVEPAIDPLWGIPLNVPAERRRRCARGSPRRQGRVRRLAHRATASAPALDAIAGVVTRRGLPLVVDQAWGPHLRFCSALPLDAMSAGADAMVASTHKLISGLTQSSVLVARGERLSLRRLETIVKMTQSTSPQVLDLRLDRRRPGTDGYAGRGALVAGRRQRRVGPGDQLTALTGRARPGRRMPRPWRRRRLSTAPASPCRPATWASTATSSRRRCATTTASPSRRPTR